MGRTVTAVMTYGRFCVGMVGPFHVDSPWWAEVEPVVAHLEETLEVHVVVLRLLSVEGSDGARDGHVTYHVEALQEPRNLTACDFVDDDHPLRLPWARASGVRELFGWASQHVDLTGRPEQRKTWNLAGLFRLPTADGPVWLKAIPPFAAAEAVAIAAVAEVDPDLVPTVLASAPGRLLLADVPGTDGWDATPGAAPGPRLLTRRMVRRSSLARRTEAPRGLEERDLPTQPAHQPQPRRHRSHGVEARGDEGPGGGSPGPERPRTRRQPTRRARGSSSSPPGQLASSMWTQPCSTSSPAARSAAPRSRPLTVPRVQGAAHRSS
jgi:hypothetical protein